MSQTNTSPLSSGSSSSRSSYTATQFKEMPGTLDCPYCNGFLIIMARADDPTGTPHHTYCSNKRSIDIATRCFGKTIFSKQSDGICYACQEPIRLVSYEHISLSCSPNILFLTESIDIAECEGEMGTQRLP